MGEGPQLKTVMLQRFNNKPDLGDSDPAFRYNIFRSAEDGNYKTNQIKRGTLLVRFIYFDLLSLSLSSVSSRSAVRPPQLDRVWMCLRS